MVGTIDDARFGTTAVHVGVGWRRAVQVGASAMAGLVLAQATLAGQVIDGRRGLVGLHETGSHVLFSVSLLVAVAAVLGWRRGQLSTGIGLLAGPALFVVMTGQIFVGYARALWLHVPLGVSLFGLSLLLAVATARPLHR